jgi:hypothetical protein
VKYDKYGNTISKSDKNFFDAPFGKAFGVFRREIAGNGHSRLLKLKIFRGSMHPDPPRMCEF